MYYLVETGESFSQASADLESAVARHGFGVLHVHDLGATLRNKGIAFDEQCRIVEACNPVQAAKVLWAPGLVDAKGRGRRRRVSHARSQTVEQRPCA